MRVLEYTREIDSFHISICGCESEFRLWKYVPGSRIEISIPDASELSDNYLSSYYNTLERYVDVYIENDGEYYDNTSSEEEEFFFEHYKEIFCGKYPEWIIYDIGFFGDGFCISYVNIESAIEDGTDTGKWCWLISAHDGGTWLKARVIQPYRPPETYYFRHAEVIEFDGRTQRSYELYKEDDESTITSRTFARIKEYANI